MIREVYEGILETPQVPQRLDYHVQETVVLPSIVHHSSSRRCSPRLAQLRHPVHVGQRTEQGCVNERAALQLRLLSPQSG